MRIRIHVGVKLQLYPDSEGKKNKPNFSKNRPINIHNGMKNFDESVIFLLFDLLDPDPDPGVSHNADPDPE